MQLPLYTYFPRGSTGALLLKHKYRRTHKHTNTEAIYCFTNTGISFFDTKPVEVEDYITFSYLNNIKANVQC